MREGFSDYLSKPVIYEALEEMLIKYLDPLLIQKEDEISSASKENEVILKRTELKNIS